MKFLKLFTAILIIMSQLNVSSFACHRDDCPHSLTDTGVHWQRSLRFSFRNQEFNLSRHHENMSKRAEEREKEEESYLNIALGNIQFVYEDGDSYRTSLPFEVRALDEENIPNPFFSNLSANQPSQYSYVKFPQGKLFEIQYELAEKFISTLGKMSLSQYIQEIDKANNLRKSIIESINGSKKTKKKRKKSSVDKQDLYIDFMSRLEKNKIKTAKSLFDNIMEKFPLSNEINEQISIYFRDYKNLKKKIQEDITTHVSAHQTQLVAKMLFGEDVWKQKIVALEKPHSPQAYLKLLQNLVEEGEAILKKEETVLDKTPLNFAWRRIQAPQKDFHQNVYLPFNRNQMIKDLEEDIKESHLQHSEQLLIHYINTNFINIKKEIMNFFERKNIKSTKIYGAFLNLFSTRDMCERCAVCLTIDHAHKNGIASKLTEFIYSYNGDDAAIDPFVVYTVSSRVPYSTPAGGLEKFDSRGGLKSVDAYSNQERGRNVLSLSKAHLSIQSFLYSQGEGEFTEDQLNNLNSSFTDVDAMVE